MTVEEKLGGTLRGVEFEHLDVAGLLASEELATMGELNLATVFDGLDFLVAHQLIVEDVHHFHTLLEASHNVETGRVQGERVGLFWENLRKLKFELIVVVVGPDADGAII